MSNVLLEKKVEQKKKTIKTLLRQARDYYFLSQCRSLMEILCAVLQLFNRTSLGTPARVNPCILDQYFGPCLP